MYKLCQQLIWLVPGKSNTYCMRGVGHLGKHNPAGNFEPPEPAKSELQSESQPRPEFKVP